MSGELYRHVGQLHISREDFGALGIEGMAQMFSSFVPVRSEFDRDNLQFFGFSRQFEQVELGAIPPVYQVRLVNGTQFAGFARIDQPTSQAA